jgi:hypothetical protein
VVAALLADITREREERQKGKGREISEKGSGESTPVYTCVAIEEAGLAMR